MKSCNNLARIVSGLLAVLLLITAPIVSRAQDLPCDGTDPFTTCPLDSWVIVLVITAGLVAAVHLHRKQKSQQA